MLSQSKSLVAVSAVRSLSTGPRLFASHYDVLGITPKANQSDIKSAYYKLSKLYHPDKSSDEESAKKFRAISEAYEVLGNVQLKKMYDRGLTTGRQNTSRMVYETEPEPTDPTLKFYKSRAYRHMSPTVDGQTPRYDYDAWTKQHYGTTFARSQYEKEFIKTSKMKQSYAMKSYQQENIIYIMFMLVFAFVYMIVQGKSDYDHPKKEIKKS